MTQKDRGTARWDCGSVARKEGKEDMAQRVLGPIIIYEFVIELNLNCNCIVIVIVNDKRDIYSSKFK